MHERECSQEKFATKGAIALQAPERERERWINFHDENDIFKIVIKPVAKSSNS